MTTTTTTRSRPNSLRPGDRVELDFPGRPHATIEELSPASPIAPDNDTGVFLRRDDSPHRAGVGLDFLRKHVREVRRDGVIIARRRWWTRRDVVALIDGVYAAILED